MCECAAGAFFFWKIAATHSHCLYQSASHGSAAAGYSRLCESLLTRSGQTCSIPAELTVFWYTLLRVWVERNDLLHYALLSISSVSQSHFRASSAFCLVSSRLALCRRRTWRQRSASRRHGQQRQRCRRQWWWRRRARRPWRWSWRPSSVVAAVAACVSPCGDRRPPAREDGNLRLLLRGRCVPQRRVLRLCAQRRRAEDGFAGGQGAAGCVTSCQWPRSTRCRSPCAPHAASSLPPFEHTSYPVAARFSV